jgi:Icc protein
VVGAGAAPKPPGRDAAAVAANPVPRYAATMRIALISDVHFGRPTAHEGRLRKLSDQAAALTREFVAQMNHSDRPDVVVNMGDVVEDDSPEVDRGNYRQFVDILAELEAPVLHVAGNHELVNLTEDDLRDLWKHQGPLYYSRDLGSVHLTVLRTEQRGDVDVHLPPAQLSWLRDDLDRARLPALVFVHHPLSDMCLEGNRWFARAPNICLVVERAEVRRVLERSGKVAAVFSGHAHWNHFDLIAGIPYVSVQSLTENVDEDAPGRAARTYSLVDVDRQRILVRVFGLEPARYQFELGPAAT